MGKHYLKIENINKITHDVLQFTLDKPTEVHFIPGQATRIAVDKEGWRDKAHPFTFTSLPNEDHLEFTIKIYPEHKGVTNELSKLKVGDQVILEKIFGAIHYEGPGVFIAGGAGVTPFISIFKDLQAKNEIAGNKLIFANKTEEDIILKDHFDSLLGENFHNILSREENEKYAHGYIDSDYLKDIITPEDKYIYLCGPKPMMDAVEISLGEIGIESDQIIKEIF